jgi:PAS domain S-box-containing protein
MPCDARPNGRQAPGKQVPPPRGVDVGQLKIEDGPGFPESKLLPAIVKSSDDAIVGGTTGGLITTWNPAAEKIYGYRAEEIIGQPLTILCPAERTGEIEEALATIGRGERTVHRETVRRRKDGRTFPVSVTASPIHDDDGRLIGVSAITRDVTEQQQARAAAEFRRRSEELEQVNRSLEAFTYSIAHDLRAPLRALGGYSSALMEDCADNLGEVGRGYAERILAASGQMSGLIDGLLILSRIARAEMHLEWVDLGAEVARIAADLEAGAPGRRVHFAIERPVQAWADRLLVRTVLHNLVENAWKFTSGQDDALIEFGTAPAGDAPLCCYVRDDGAGFDPAYAGKLFQPFQRLHAVSDFPGTGIGLASVKQIVDRHGGRAWAEGAAGEGATFFFTLDAEEIA